MHPEFKIQKICLERFANPINKRVHTLFQITSKSFATLRHLTILTDGYAFFRLVSVQEGKFPLKRYHAARRMYLEVQHTIPHTR